MLEFSRNIISAMLLKKTFKLFPWLLMFTELLCKLRVAQTKPVEFDCTFPGLINVDNINSCFLDPDSAKCLSYIACKRRISLAATMTLKRESEELYAATQEPQPFSTFDGRTLWIACLASTGLLRPGPDSDCAACGNACTQESKAEVCLLYCSWNESNFKSNFEITSAKPNMKVKEKVFLMSGKEIMNNSIADVKIIPMISFKIVFLIIGFSGLFSILVIFIIMVLQKRNLQQKRVPCLHVGCIAN